jgi:hypothetical protein
MEILINKHLSLKISTAKIDSFAGSLATQKNVFTQKGN